MLRCYVTDRRRGDVISAAKRAVETGINMIQVREKDLEARALFDLVRTIVKIAEGSQTQVLVNDRLDVALAAGAAGVHLPADGLPAVEVRPFVKLVGVSTHSVEDVRQAAASGADFTVFGPVFDTPGKVPVGIERLRAAVACAPIPVLAIGGITLENAQEVIEAGAAGFAAIRLFQGGEN